MFVEQQCKFPASNRSTAVSNWNSFQTFVSIELLLYVLFIGEEFLWIVYE